jgi:hypothetical protein
MQKLWIYSSPQFVTLASGKVNNMNRYAEKMYMHLMMAVRPKHVVLW